MPSPAGGGPAYARAERCRGAGHRRTRLVRLGRQRGRSERRPPRRPGGMRCPVERAVPIVAPLRSLHDLRRGRRSRMVFPTAADAAVALRPGRKALAAGAVRRREMPLIRQPARRNLVDHYMSSLRHPALVLGRDQLDSWSPEKRDRRRNHRDLQICGRLAGRPCVIYGYGDQVVVRVRTPPRHRHLHAAGDRQAPRRASGPAPSEGDPDRRRLAGHSRGQKRLARASSRYGAARALLRTHALAEVLVGRAARSSPCCSAIGTVPAGRRAARPHLLVRAGGGMKEGVVEPERRLQRAWRPPPA